MDERFEKIPQGKERLLELEKDGKYLFHGSPTGNIEIFEPRQSQTVADINQPKEMVNDGSPAISATPYADIAVFRAIFNRNNIKIPHTNSFSSRGSEQDTKLAFTVSSQEVIDHVKGKNGYVYVFNKSDFTPYDRDGGYNEHGMEWRAYKELEPVEVIEVTSEDLPKDSIEIR